MLKHVVIDFITGSFNVTTVTKKGCAERIVQLVSAFNSSRLGFLLQKLSEADRTEHGLLYLQDFLLLSLKIKSRDELKVHRLTAQQ